MLTEQIHSITCRACGADIGVPPRGDRAECPRCGQAAQLDNTARTTTSTLPAKPEVATAATQPLAGAVSSAAEMVAKLEALLGAHKAVQAACEKIKRERSGGFLECLAFFILFAVAVAITLKLPSEIPPLARFGVFVGLLVAAFFPVRYLAAWRGKSRIAAAARDRNSEQKSLQVNIATMVERYPQAIAAWGGPNVLQEPTQVAQWLQGLRGQLTGSNGVIAKRDKSNRGAWALVFAAAGILRLIASLTGGAKAPAQDANSYLNQGTAWLDKKDYDKAISDFDEAIRREPTSAIAFNNRGLAWDGKNEHDKAILDCNEAIRLDRTFAMAFNNRGFAWAGKKEYDRAIKDYDEAIRLDPKLAVAFSNRGLAWNEKNEYSKAIRDCDEAIRRDPKLAVAFNHRGYGWAGKRDFDRAVKDFDEAVRLDPTFALAINNRGLVWSWKKDYGRTISDYDTSIRLEPNNASFSSNLAWLLATCPERNVRDGSRAIQLATKACEITGWNSYMDLDCLAAAYAEAGKYVEAERYQAMVLDDPACQGPAGEPFRQRLELYKQKKPYREDQ